MLQKYIYFYDIKIIGFHNSVKNFFLLQKSLYECARINSKIEFYTKFYRITQNVCFIRYIKKKLCLLYIDLCNIIPHLIRLLSLLQQRLSCIIFIKGSFDSV
ncbi:hypothetical protein EDEG_02998 [Edhazardia aedis USNM 41457]|uniref:Uncharacterized protein n=1 Tax=Edhazardia aedis (strain USNM 41457) TaxID=1003232 RepID=J9D492_EDHAE|nr:hypothetical protein EDEG_02998 [Edhazardia aedis USNM 41457]|eukprot:EJW02601.1 hypothetical protein EDEG_02998 [Edhazardia aedis USNM 41457]